MQNLYLSYLILSILSLLCYKIPRLSSAVLFFATAVVSACGAVFFICNLNEIHTLNLGGNFLFSPKFRLDVLGNFFSFIICTISALASLFSLVYIYDFVKKSNLAVFASLNSAFILSMLLVISADNVFSFLVLWEIMTLISALLIMVNDDNKTSSKVVMIYLGIAQIGAFCIVCGLLIIASYSASLEFSNFVSVNLGVWLNFIVFVLFFIGFGSKAGIWPFHIWLPMAHPIAPSNISALMSGVMLKVAIFAFIKFCLFLEISTTFAYILMIFGGIAAFANMASAAIQNNFKVAIAYSSCENIGIIFMAIGVCFYAIATGNEILIVAGFLATLYHILNHSVFKSLLFLGSGAIHHRTHTYDMDRLGGLGAKMPKIAFCFLIGSLSAAAIPLFAGFSSEWILYKSLFIGGIDIGVTSRLIFILSILLLSMAGIFAVMSFSKIYGAIFSGSARDNSIHAKECDIFMIISLGILAIFCVILGVFVQNISEFLLSIISSISNFKNLTSTPENFANLPLIFVLLALFGILPVILMLILKANNAKSRASEPWACGFKYSPNMQIASNPFSGDIRRILKFFYRSKNEVKIKDYFAEIEYKSETREFWWSKVYEPVVKFCLFLGDKIGAMQNGRSNFYTGYILAYLCLVLIFGYYFL